MAARVTPESNLSRPASLSRPRLTGRERELADLRRVLNVGGALVLVEGEAGIGKTRLLAELWQDAGPVQRPLVASCPPLPQPHTLGAVVDAVHGRVDEVGLPRLSDLGGALRPLFPEWRAVLPPAPDPSADASASRHRLFRALVELVTSLDVTILVVEDAHWADEATLEFLLFVLARAPSMSVVVTARPEEVPPRSLMRRLMTQSSARPSRLRMSLGPLDVAQTGALVSSMLAGEPLSTRFAELVHANTDGVPLAIEESVYLMRERAELVRRDGRWLRRRTTDIAIAPTLRDITLERAARLSEPARGVFAALAVLAVASHESTVAAVAGLGIEQTRAALAECLDAGLLTENRAGRIGFRHAIPARTIYASTPAPLRRTLHERAALELASVSPQPHAQLATHFREAGEIARWSRHAEQAADQSLLTGDERTAARLLCDVVVHADLPAPTLARLAGRIPYASVDADLYRDLAATIERAIDDGDLAELERGAARVVLARVHMYCDDYAAARTQLDSALPELAADVSSSVQALTLMAWPHDESVPATTHLAWLDRAASLAVGLDPASAGSFGINRMSALLYLGDVRGWAEVTALPEDSDVPADRHRVAAGQLNAGNAALQWGRYADADHRLTRAVRLAEKYEYQTLAGMAKASRARLAWYRGEWTDLDQRVADLLDDDVGSTQWIELRFVVGCRHAAEGRFAKARDSLRGALDRARETHAIDLCLEPAAALARLGLLDGSVDDALALTDDLGNAVVRKGMWIWATDVLPVRVAALVRAERLAEAADLVEVHAAGLSGREISASRAGLLLSQAVLAEGHQNWAEAADRFGEAATAWQRLPRPYDAWLATERRAECLLRYAGHDVGAATLREAFDGFSTLGARWDADRVLRRLRESGVDVRRPRGGGRPSYGTGLSPREIEVVRLLCAGHTNRRIAETLVLSVQTVASHLRSAMRKLEVPSRTALALRAVELGYVAVDGELFPCSD